MTEKFGESVAAVMGRRLAMLSVAGALLMPVGSVMWAQTAASATSAPAVARQRGTVKAIDGSTMTLTTDDGQTATVSVMGNAKVLQLAPGSTDLKSAQTIALQDVSVGDRVLVIGAAAPAGGAFQAGRVILMKSTDIAAQHSREEADWQRRGSGGIVTAVDAGTISMAARGKTIAVKTSSSTVFRRYAGDSVKFEDARPGTLEQIHAGDQMRVRGTRSADGTSIDAEEIVSGRFENLSGKLTAVDPDHGTVTLEDLATKKPVTVQLTSNSAIRALPAGAAAALASGSHEGAAGRTEAAGGSRPAAASAGVGGSEGAHRGGGDLSQMVARLPQISVAELHPGDAVLIVATPPSHDSTAVTAITLVSGVQPLLTAAQGSASAVTLSPWSLGENGGEAAGGASQ